MSVTRRVRLIFRAELWMQQAYKQGCKFSGFLAAAHSSYVPFFNFNSISLNLFFSSLWLQRIQGEGQRGILQCGGGSHSKTSQHYFHSSWWCGTLISNICYWFCILKVDSTMCSLRDGMTSVSMGHRKSLHLILMPLRWTGLYSTAFIQLHSAHLHGEQLWLANLLFT